MPRKPKRGPALRGTSELSADQLDYLTSGFSMFNGDTMPFASVEDMEKAYKKNKAVVNAEVLKERVWAKHLRSWGWWKFSAPEPRRQLSGPDPLSHLPMTRGIPDLWESRETCEAAVYETELQYLQRLNLLQPTDEEEPEEVTHDIIYNRK